MEEKEINPNESLAIIDAMINKTKNKLADDGFYFIFWGWLVTLCALGYFVLLKLEIYNSGIIWPVFMSFGGLVSILKSRKQNKTEKVKTYLDDYLGYLWKGVLIAIVTTIAFSGVHGIKYTYFTLILLYGIGAYVTGGLINFKPLIIGGLISFAFAIASVFLSDINQLLIISGALICSHIVPGHLLRSKFKSQNV